mgnify:CR=1 FL=1
MRALEFTLVFLVPMFIALAINTFFRKKQHPNLKIVYYKTFTFIVILFLASQIHIQCKSSSVKVIRVIGSILMASLVFELFLMPSELTDSSDIMPIHDCVLWLTLGLLFFNCARSHFKDLTNGTLSDIPLYRIDKIALKLGNTYTMPQQNCTVLPITNIFSCYSIIDAT